MQFTVPKSTLLHILDGAVRVTDRRGAQPILGNVLISVTGTGLACSATDMIIAVHASAACLGGDPGQLTLGGRHLQNVIRTLPDGDVHFLALDNSWAQIKAGRSEFKLMGMPAGDFPELPDPTGKPFVTLASHRLVDLIDKTLFSVSTDEARVNLNGALFECDGKRATMVSTDGHRLTKYSVELPGPKLAKPVIIPRKGMDEIRKALSKLEGECELAIVDGYLFVKADALTLSVKLNNVTFPPYQQVVPSTRKRRVEVGREEMIAALRQSVVIAPEKTATVKLSLESDAIRIEADNPELGAIKLSLAAEILEGESNGFTAGFNATYLTEALTALGTERAWIDMVGDLDPAVIRPVAAADSTADFLAVVMPMRI